MDPSNVRNARWSADRVGGWSYLTSPWTTLSLKRWKTLHGQDRTCARDDREFIMLTATLRCSSLFRFHCSLWWKSLTDIELDHHRLQIEFYANFLITWPIMTNLFIAIVYLLVISKCFQYDDLWFSKSLKTNQHDHYKHQHHHHLHSKTSQKTIRPWDEKEMM